MSLTPETIEQQLFTQRFRGYDQQEVDQFLDRVSDQLAQLAQERDELAARVAELEQASKTSGEAEKLLQRTLVAAQRTADETVHDARSTAEQTIADARAEAEEILASARRDAAAQQEHAKAVADRIHQAVDELARFRSEYRERLEALLSEQLAILDRTDLPEPPEDLGDLRDVVGGGARAGEV